MRQRTSRSTVATIFASLLLCGIAYAESDPSKDYGDNFSENPSKPGPLPEMWAVEDASRQLALGPYLISPGPGRKDYETQTNTPPEGPTEQPLNTDDGLSLRFSGVFRDPQGRSLVAGNTYEGQLRFSAGSIGPKGDSFDYWYGVWADTNGDGLLDTRVLDAKCHYPDSCPAGSPGVDENWKVSIPAGTPKSKGHLRAYVGLERPLFFGEGGKFVLNPIHPDSWQGGRAMSATSDGGYVLSGSTYAPSTGITEHYLAKLKSDLSVTMWKQWPAADPDHGEYLSHVLPTYKDPLKQLGPDGYLLTGAKFYPESEEVAPLVIKTDLQGNVLWSLTREPDWLFRHAWRAVQLTDGSGDFVVVATRWQQGELFRIAGNGQLVWSISFPAWWANQDMVLSKDAAGNVDGIIVLYTTGGLGGTGVKKYDFNGNLLPWSSNDFAFNYPKSIVQTPDRGFLIVGSEEDGLGLPPRPRIAVLRLDASGAAVDKFYYEMSDPELFEDAHDIVATLDGNYLAVGHYGYQNEVGKGLAFALDVNGKILGGLILRPNEVIGDLAVGSKDGCPSFTGGSWANSTNIWIWQGCGAIPGGEIEDYRFNIRAQ